MTAGLHAEREAFATAVVDPAGGKAGIREFMDKKSPPLPIRRDGVFVDGEHMSRGSVLQATRQLLPVGAPFFPAVDAVPAYQYAFGIARDEASGAPRFGPPGTHERELIVPVDRPEPNDALVYMLTSEVNFNDIWALTGIPVSPFDGHENDYQTTGSGGVGLVAALGSEARAEGRLKVGDLVAVYSGTNDLLSPQVGRDPMFADFAIQGYETPTGSHAQFLTVQAPQLHAVPGDLTLEQAGSYILNLGTVWRALFTTLDIEGGRTIFVEGAATGTGHDAMKHEREVGASGDRAGVVTGARRICRQRRRGRRDRPDRPALGERVHRRARGRPRRVGGRRRTDPRRLPRSQWRETRRLCRQPRGRDRLPALVPVARRRRGAGLLRRVVGLSLHLRRQERVGRPRGGAAQSAGPRRGGGAAVLRPALDRAARRDRPRDDRGGADGAGADRRRHDDRRPARVHPVARLRGRARRGRQPRGHRPARGEELRVARRDAAPARRQGRHRGVPRSASATIRTRRSSPSAARSAGCCARPTTRAAPPTSSSSAQGRTRSG